MADEERQMKETTDEPATEETQTVEAAAPAEDIKAEKAVPSGQFADLIQQIESLSVLELSALVKALEERFGVSAATPMMAVGALPAAGGAGAGAEAADEGKAMYAVHLVDAGAQKIAVIKAVREIRPDLGLKQAKDLVDAAPKEVKPSVPKAEAEEAKTKLEAAGAKVELK